jgi:uncharacterized cupredoxin-like copper-binding protein
VIPRELRRRRVLALAAATSLVAGVSGCGGDDDKTAAPTTARTPAPTTTAESRPTAFSVTEREYSLTPKNPELPLGEFTITVHNAGATQHALEIHAPEGEVETDAIQPGGKAQLAVKLTKPGRYEWYCPIGDHEERGMRGTIVVAGESTGDGSGKDDSGGRDRRDRRDGSGGDSSGRGGSGSGRNDDSTREDNSGGSEGDSGGIGPSNDSGYGPSQ